MYYSICEIIPEAFGDHYRRVETFYTREDASLGLNTLEKVNSNFNTYKIKEGVIFVHP